ncbi:D-alanine--D-alanine ligase A [Dyadobacter sp. CECT 9275]|uniref:D-alanine--D-alanine ligase n=1 Tax=Dyadobacter helix TaxID=2822344 RepID=A0A916N606_9BACT|nr:D-alanine--D-alanine ligase family protein [Dyadobacter sp. CECT 9275]CAG5000887.1 D-alanine--D-alanine ligase A [Dyadobacter sp. CECT 9275]
MKTTVAVIFGGKSAEHDVSLKSATNIYNAIDTTELKPLLLGVDYNGQWRFNDNYGETNVDLYQNDYFSGASFVSLKKGTGAIEIISQDSNRSLASFHVAFPIIHGTFGEDGTLQGILKSLEVAYVGPDILGSAIGMDKEVAKRLLRDAGIPISAFFTLYRHNPGQFSFEEIVQELGLPLFVKPANAGSSVGVSKVANKAEFERAVSEAFIYDKKILVEEAVFGKEVECAVLGNEVVKASVLGEIVSAANFYSYEEKYLNLDGVQTKIPAEIGEQASAQIRATAIKAFGVLCCEGMSRIDFFLREDNTFVLNEINTLPGFTATSMYPQLWEHTGIPYPRLLSELVQLAQHRQERETVLKYTI